MLREPREREREREKVRERARLAFALSARARIRSRSSSVFFTLLSFSPSAYPLLCSTIPDRWTNLTVPNRRDNFVSRMQGDRVPALGYFETRPPALRARLSLQINR